MNSRVRIGLTLIVFGFFCVALLLGVTALGIYLQYSARNEVNFAGQPRFEMPGWALLVFLVIAAGSMTAIITGVQIALRPGKDFGEEQVRPDRKPE